MIERTIRYIERPPKSGIVHAMNRAMIRTMTCALVCACLAVWGAGIADAEGESAGESADESGAVWVDLFNGEDFSGWRTFERGSSAEVGEITWTITDGVMTNDAGTIPDIATRTEYGDFELRYEYKAEGNSGVFLRGLWEIQINKPLGDKKTSRSDGGLYSLHPPLADATKPMGEWNSMVVVVEGGKITAHQNGTLIHDAQECKSTTWNHRLKTPLPGPRGPIVLQGDHERVWFRNIKIKPTD